MGLADQEHPSRMATTFSRSDTITALRAKAWSAARAQTVRLLDGELAVDDLYRLATETTRLADAALASVSPVGCGE